MEKEAIEGKTGARSYFEFGVRVQHDVFAGTLDVLGPAGQPGHRLVMPYLLPAVTSRGLWDTGIAAGKFREHRNRGLFVWRNLNVHMALLYKSG